MRLLLASHIEDGEDVVGRAGLRIGGNIFRHVGRREATRVEGNRAIALAEMPQLRFKTPDVAGELMDKDHGPTAAGLLEIQAHAVVCRRVGHQAGPLLLPWPLFARGSTTMNSVKLPGSVATSMVPPCCLTMMSWVIDRPSPVPSPAGLVGKNGLNIFSFTSRGMPVPLLRMRISTLFPRRFVEALRAGSKPSPPASLRLVAA